MKCPISGEIVKNLIIRNGFGTIDGKWLSGVDVLGRGREFSALPLTERLQDGVIPYG